MYKIVFYIFLLYVTVLGNTSQIEDELSQTYCDGTGWTTFKDEKCIKLIKKWATREEAKQICAQELLKSDSSTPQLVSIKSPAELNYLVEYIFDTSSVKANVWIGAERLSDGQFVWNDGTDIEFTNWADGSPTIGVAERSCVVMQSDYTRSSVKGKWRDVTCEQAMYVVCEKLQRWSFVKMQQAFLDTRKKHTDELEEANKKIHHLEANAVPIGFIYTQLPNEKVPSEIFPSMTWADVSATYAGVFFRVNGGSATAFGQVQEDNSPILNEAFFTRAHEVKTGRYTSTWNTGIEIPRSGWSDGIFTGGGNGEGVYLQFKHSAGEVRPRNMAIRIWKRTG